MSQNLPTLVGYQLDTMCNSDFDFAVVYDILIEDLDADSTYIYVDLWDGSDFLTVQAVNPPHVAGQTIRTFKILADASTGLSPGLNLSNMTISAYGNVTNDLGYTSGLTISGIPAYGYIPVTINLSSLSMCENDNPIDIRPYASPAGGVFTWANQTSYMFDPEIYLNNGAGIIYYDYVNAAGCSGYSSSGAPVLFTAPSIFINISNSICGNDDGIITSSISGIAPPYQLYWSNGTSEVVSGLPADLTDLAPGNYYANITDANGCKAVGLGQISDNEVGLSESITPETCKNASSDGEIELNIFSTLGSVDFIYWSNGQTTSTASNLTTGEYTVEVRTDAGCEANGTYFVDASPLFYAETYSSIDATCSSSDGAIDISLVNGSGSYNFAWSNGASSEDISSIPSGTYKCVITDITTGCVTNYKRDIFSSFGPGAYMNYIIQPTCGQNNGVINLNVYPYSAPVTSVSWSSGQTTEDIQNIGAGAYELTVTALDGCVFKHTVTIGSLPPEPPQICMLSVDTSLIYNMVIWEKDLSQPNIAGYKIYRETSQYGVFELVSTRPYALESIFQDNDASPVDRSWRYYITAYDACGNESDPSFVHKTIHVVANTSNGTDYTISWDNYEGFVYSSVDVFRFDSTNGWQTITNIPYGTNLALDTPPILTGLDYMIEFVLTSSCTSTKAQDHNSTRSNKTASIFSGGGTTVQIQDEEMGIISIYPNPTNDILTLHVDNPELFQYYEVTDLNGKVISTGTIMTNNTNIDLYSIQSGVYMIRLISDGKIVVNKFVKN